MAVVEMKGKTFGRLTVVTRAENDKKRRQARWNCVCECGNKSVVGGNDLRRGNTQSCGCFNLEQVRGRSITHGRSRNYTRDYMFRVFHSAKNRCNNPKNGSYAYWGGRGIQFLFSSVEQLATELGERPTPQHSIDRINNDGHYEPGNVKWSTKREQSLNRRITPKLLRSARMNLLKGRATRWPKYQERLLAA